MAATKDAQQVQNNIKELTEKKILEEEERFAKETEERLKNQEERMKEIQAQIDMQDKTDHEAQLALDADAHKAESEAKAA